MLNVDYSSTHLGAGYHMVDPSYHCHVHSSGIGSYHENNSQEYPGGPSQIAFSPTMNASHYHNYNVVENVNNCRNIDTSRPLSSLEYRVKLCLENWRLYRAKMLGQNDTAIMHDIFIESVARSADQIRTFDDFYRVAYYWKLIDQYGLEAFDAIRDELQVNKRQRNEYEGPSRKRMRS